MTMIRTNWRLDYLVSAILGVFTIVVSPIGLHVIRDRSLSTRDIVMTLALDTFLLVWIGAILTQGRYRRFFFHLMVWTFPLVLLDGLEEVARSLRLAERILPITDESVLLNRRYLRDYFYDETRSVPANPGWRLYKPHNSDGLFINDLGLRTSAPKPKTPGEWRVAISGGSAVFGFRVRDVDTISENLERLLQHVGSKITVYNFGIEGATLEAELLTLQRFREIYSLDSVVFYTGSNDVLKAYRTATSGRQEFESFFTPNFELTKAAIRVNALMRGVDVQDLVTFERNTVSPILQDNPLRKGLSAAEAYCISVKLACTFVLQPTLATRKIHPAGEAKLAKTYEFLFFGMKTLTQDMYRDAITADHDARLYDLSNLFDEQTKPFFMDHVHVNEDANRVIAEALMPIVLKTVPDLH